MPLTELRNITGANLREPMVSSIVSLLSWGSQTMKSWKLRKDIGSWELSACEGWVNETHG